MKDYKDVPVKFYLPDFWGKYRTNTSIINMLKERPEYFRDNISVGAIYGSFPNNLWNSGRVFFGSADQENIRNTIYGINSLGIPLRFTFTSSEIKEHDVYDSLCNMILKIADMKDVNCGVRNEILVNHPVLEEYLRVNYPKFRYLSSTTKCLDKEAFVREIEQYDLTVMDFHYNMDKKFLEELSRNNKQDKVELLINPYCSPSCSFQQRAEHYKYLSKCQRNLVNPEMFCNILKLTFEDCLENSTTYSQDFLWSYLYEKLGFRHFKIEGRTNHPVDVIDSYVYYMVKPEYERVVRNNLLRGSWGVET